MSGTKDAPTSEDRRENETSRYDELLRKTCRPLSEISAVGPEKSPDSVLTGLAQLATCQTNTERSFVSLFDEIRQYIVAEATPSTSLLNSSSLHNSDDDFLLCGTYIPRTDGACHYALRATEESLDDSSSPELPVIVIQDLAADPRFASSPNCRPGSFARFYAAVPIRSPRGINIGVLCVMNSTPGGDWTDKHANIMRGLSQTIMDHLEGNRIKHSLKRSTAMSLGLQRFTERGLNSPVQKSHVGSEFHTRGTPTERDNGDISSTQSVPLDIPKYQRKDHTSSNPFVIAATIIKEALPADNCAFFSGDSRDLHLVHSPETDTQYDFSLDASCLSPGVHSSASVSDTPTAIKFQPSCQLLGSSNAPGSNDRKDVDNISQAFLFHMLQQYPEGYIFDFDSPGPFTDDTESFASPSEEHSLSIFPRNEHHIYEQRELQRAFSGARYVAFIPIWDPLKGLVSIGGFAWSKSLRREHDRDSELPFFRALGILAASEAFQVETLAADKAKSDVLGSISHELRSPLHGITLGLELLNDSGLGAAQQNIAHLIGTCCRTLLDTTEHLLDFTKVNQSGGSDTIKDDRSERSTISTALSNREQIMNKTVHLDQIAEDAVESVYAGHSYQHASIAHIFSSSNSRTSAYVSAIRRMDSIEAAEAKAIDQRNRAEDGVVSVFLLYDPTISWSFQTQAGAIRRIIMNLFGNSLKYTSQGFIKVTMAQSQSEDEKGGERMIVLVVEDTGRGISEDFLRNNIFKPFSQEDQLSTGTGLGLSFVQRMTYQLGGTISISSQVDVGTKVTVSIPMLPGINSPGSEIRVYTQSPCQGLRARLTDLPPSHGVARQHESMTCQALMKELCFEHLGMVSDASSEAEQLAPDVVVVQDSSTSNISELARSWPDAPVLVVCNNALVVQRYESAHVSTGHRRLCDYVAQPFTPNKLERAVSRAVTLWAETEGSPHSAGTIPLPTPSDTISFSQLPTPAIASPLGGLVPVQDYFQTPQFLLVEDNPINLKMLTHFMRKLQKPYRTAVNGQEAVNAYKEMPGQFRCILMDISMPVMDGLEATRQIRAFERYNAIAVSKILAITGLGSESTREEATRSGVDVFITKPVKLRELEVVINS
ncbi:related to nik-1 protein (Os-1p protein) [Fusarium fujikuroi]|nr:related to nik-1 protein (Os-1p protein) [Fusarium fujikuroi]SCO20975.1 related to nik-1 protein (Os-1p protein) [Fusarium fujikuroi]SCO51191.1 related to nik-1 protein (Os-1p protein) [Fusarium fujikuroi]SCV59871.1 related to nik-1 protein (Os-1p protein) [Fusarium fujikuroi]